MLITSQPAPLICALLLLICYSGPAESQYPGEECHWECAVIYCDYYSDYCEYDCYEVCYPYRSKPLGQSSVPQILGKSPSRSASYVKGASASAQTQVESQVHRLSAKPVRMRLSNPSFQTVYRGQVALTRGSPPKGFAVFQGCLRNDNRKTFNDAIDPVKFEPAVNQSPRNQQEFGLSGLGARA